MLEDALVKLNEEYIGMIESKDFRIQEAQIHS